MPTTDWKLPGTAVGNRAITGSDADWTTADNIKSDSGVAEATLLSDGDETSGLAASNFDFSEILTDAKILGIEVQVGNYFVNTTLSVPVFKFVKLIKADDTDGTDSNDTDYLSPTTSPQTDANGITLELWGDEWTRADVTDVDFGCFISFSQSQAGTTGYDVTFIKMRITWAIGTDWKFPGTMVGNRGTGKAWVNPDNAKADDASDTNVALGAAQLSAGLAATNFDFSSIPTGATIDGIEIRVGDYIMVAGTTDWTELRLILADDSDGSQERSATLPNPFGIRVTSEIGGATDLWTEALSRTDVTDVDFGFFITCVETAAGADLAVDFMQMRVFYHEGLPTTIISNVGGWGHHPPFKSSAGAFYAIVRESTALHAFKASDPTTDSWAEQDGSNEPFGLNPWSCVQDGDDIHCIFAVGGPTSVLRYAIFNMATDLWELVTAGTGELVESIIGAAPDQGWVSIAVRSDGDVIVCYNGQTDANMGNEKERVDVNIRTSGTWGGPVALDAGGDVHYGNPNCVLGTNDGTHFIWQEQTDVADDPPIAWSTHSGRTLDSGDSLGTVDTNSFATGTSLLGLQNLVTYDDGGTQRMRACGRIGSSSPFHTYNAIESSGEWSGSAALIESVLTANMYVNGEVGILSLTELSGDLHLIYSGGGASAVDQDIWYTKSTNNGTDWDTETEELDAVTCNFISANIYVRGLDTVLAYVYDDGGVQKYNEKILIEGIQPFHHVIKEKRRDMRGMLTL